MKMHSKCALLWFALLVSLLIPAKPSLSKELTKIEDLQPPPWPLPPLNRLEREARLRFVLESQNYHTAEAKAPLTENDCNELLKTLNDPSAVHILDPDVIAQSRDDKNVPDNLIEHCSTVEMDRIWFSWEKGVLSAGVDPSFDSLPLDKKDLAADYYHLKTGNIEFYNLSSFFGGKKTWGTFAEDGKLVCNVDSHESFGPLCSAMEGYRLTSDVVVGPVVDAESCTLHLVSKVKSGGRLRVGTRHPYAFRETLNFHAYAEIDNALYRLGLSGAGDLGELHLLHEGNATFVVEPANTKKGGYCIYEPLMKRGD